MTLHTAHEWCKILHVSILDPDGWRLGDGVTMDTPIDGNDFLRRFGVSTVSVLARPDQMNELLESYLADNS